MAKSIVTLFFLLFIKIYHAQWNFPYIQQWGTFVGGVGTNLSDFYNNDGLILDSQNNIYLDGRTVYNSQFPSSYYSQFVMGGGVNNTSPDLSQDYMAKFTVNGLMTYGSYTSTGKQLSLATEKIIGIDHLDNKYIVNSRPGTVPNLATPGAWLVQPPPLDPNNPFTYTLSKYSPSGNLLWTTYTPSIIHNFSLDENNNSFFSFPVNQEIVGFSTAGTFQPNFVTPSNNLLSSGVIKFSPMGQKIWATYCLASVSLLSYHNGALYFASGYDANAPWTPATAGTFQTTTTADTIIMKWDANTGQRVWSTFYGPPNGLNLMGVYGLKATDSGLYISGSSNNASYPTYYATPGAHKTQLTGEEDLFLSKFNMQTGQRIWSTYFGSDGYDTIMGGENITVLGERIVITGNQFGANGNIATPGAFLTAPQSTAPNLSNKFFAVFEAEGGRLVWASYFGGVTSGASPEEINPKFLNDGTLLLWGDTSSMTGVTTANGYFPTKILSSETIGFLTRFAFNNMATQESNASQDLQLYDNPNNGNFSLVGKALAQKNLQLKLYDASGRLVVTRKLNTEKKQSFEFQNLLSKGNYLLEISDNKATIKTFKMIVK